ncbi:hypothetical protein KI387_001840, partial [Taxus chinensis]
ATTQVQVLARVATPALKCSPKTRIGLGVVPLYGHKSNPESGLRSVVGCYDPDVWIH